MRTIAITFLLVFVSFAATQNSQYEVRTATGNDANGCGYDSGATGVDYSQQDSAQFSGTDLVIDGSNNAKVTSASHTFVANDVGNHIMVSAGTGFNLLLYSIQSVSSGAAIVDKVVGTTGSTGGTWKLGGACATIANVMTKFSGSAPRNPTIWVKGTSTLTTPLTFSNMAAPDYGPNTIRAYSTTHGDSGRATITTSTNSTTLLTLNASGLVFIQFDLTNTAGTRALALTNPGFAATYTASFYDCTFDGFTYVSNTQGYLTGSGAADFRFERVEIKNGTSGGIIHSGGLTFLDSFIHDNAGDGVYVIDSCGPTFYVGNTFKGNSGVGLKMFGCDSRTTMTVHRNNFVDNTSDGFRFDVARMSRISHQNNIYYGNGGYGFKYVSYSPPLVFTGTTNKCNAYGSNTSGARDGLTAGDGDVTLSADPFTNKASNDLSLNSTVGGGAALKGAGFSPSYFGTGSIDIGALQSSSAGSGGSSNYSSVQ